MIYKILLVEDELKMQNIIKDYFEVKGCNLVCANNGLQALEVLSLQQFDLILLDVIMPKLDVFSLCKKIRRDSEVPIIFLTAKTDEEDKLYGYELEADDYVTKPFSLAVLFAKSTALINRTEGRVVSEKLQAGGITIYPERKEIKIDDTYINLPNLEYKILLFFIRNEKRIVSREQLLNQVWDHAFDGSDRVVDSHVKKLRKAIKPYDSYIKTVVKIGYKFEVNYEK